jgi:hypothetical protein
LPAAAVIDVHAGQCTGRPDDRREHERCLEQVAPVGSDQDGDAEDGDRKENEDEDEDEHENGARTC